MKLNIWFVPWLLAIAGAVLPLVEGYYQVWPLSAGWLIALALLRVVGKRGALTWAQRIGFGLVAVPALLLMASFFGPLMIPADVAWVVLLVFERLSRSRVVAAG